MPSQSSSVIRRNIEKIMLKLKSDPTLSDFQKYVEKLELERGFDDQSARDKCLLLGEEVGELFKAVRKSEGLKIDTTSAFGSISDGLTDILTLSLHKKDGKQPREPYEH